VSDFKLFILGRIHPESLAMLRRCFPGVEIVQK
jgi:hypothetical protein